MRKKVTLKQLAKELNISISTVSKSLKNDPEISDKTIKRVHELAKFYNYKPNALAVSLKSNKTKTIGVLLPEILNNFFAKVLFGIEQKAAEKGYKIVTCITNESHQKEVEYTEMLNYSSVDGFIIALSEETQKLNKVDHFKELTNDKIPIVMFDRVTEDINCDKVIVDDKNASKMAIKHFIDTGCKNILLLSEIYELSVGKLRLEGAKEVIAKHTNISLNELQITDPEKSQKVIEAFLKNNKVDAILGLDEIAVAIAINLANKLGYKVPKEISIIGFADNLLSQYSFPKLTAISQHAEELGSKAAEMLLDRLEEDSSEKKYVPKTEVVKTSLLLRDSTL